MQKRLPFRFTFMNGCSPNQNHSPTVPLPAVWSGLQHARLNVHAAPSGSIWPPAHRAALMPSPVGLPPLPGAAMRSAWFHGWRASIISRLLP